MNGEVCCEIIMPVPVRLIYTSLGHKLLTDIKNFDDTKMLTSLAGLTVGDLVLFPRSHSAEWHSHFELL